jgi:hypothetical protein
MCVKPISRMNSSLACSDRIGIVFVTLNMVLMMSWHEYPESLQSQVSILGSNAKTIELDTRVP